MPTNGITYYEGLGCLKHYNTTKSWNNARSTCQGIYADLVTVDPTTSCDELDAFHALTCKRNYKQCVLFVFYSASISNNDIEPIIKAMYSHFRDLPPYAKRSPIQKCKNFDRNMLCLGNKFVSIWKQKRNVLAVQ